MMWGGRTGKTRRMGWVRAGEGLTAVRLYPGSRWGFERSFEKEAGKEKLTLEVVRMPSAR